MLKDNELINKYIRYSPEISGEIFDKIITGLNLAGCRWYNKSSIPLTLYNFKECGFIKIYNDKDFAITSTGEDVEISYKDIIGDIPEYVECLEWNGDYCKVGEIYPIVRYNENILHCTCKSPHYTSGVIGCNSGKFKFSTKEAYEAQFKKEWWKNLKEGDFIVCIKDDYHVDIPKNYIFKFLNWQSYWIYLRAEWLNNNTYSAPPYQDFRLATPDEIAMYEEFQCPVPILKKDLVIFITDKLNLVFNE